MGIVHACASVVGRDSWCTPSARDEGNEGDRARTRVGGRARALADAESSTFASPNDRVFFCRGARARERVVVMLSPARRATECDPHVRGASTPSRAQVRRGVRRGVARARSRVRGGGGLRCVVSTRVARVRDRADAGHARISIGELDRHRVDTFDMVD